MIVQHSYPAPTQFALVAGIKIPRPPLKSKTQKKPSTTRSLGTDHCAVVHTHSPTGHTALNATSLPSSPQGSQETPKRGDQEREQGEGDLTMPLRTSSMLLSGALFLLLATGLCFLEMEMGSEAHKRLLWEAMAQGQGRYISYTALRGDAVPCSRPGVPYYNCRIMTTANPYTRGCETITRCRDADP